jgi:Cu+-exporting ATPase
LIKGGRALEESSGIRTIELNKRGAITEGKLKVAELFWVPSNAAVLELETLATASADGFTPRSTPGRREEGWD